MVIKFLMSNIYLNEINDIEFFRLEKIEIKPFDLKDINQLPSTHPYQKLIGHMVLCDPDELYDRERNNHFYDFDIISGDLDFKEYFKWLDNYYRYGIVFNEEYEVFPGNILYVASNYPNDCVWESLLASGLSEKIDGPFYHYIINRFDHANDIIIQTENIRKIKLDDLDGGEKTLSEIERWKRKIVYKQTGAKLSTLLHPNNYHSFINFYQLSKMDKIPDDKYLKEDILKYRNQKFDKIDYDILKEYEDNLYKKVGKYLD